MIMLTRVILKINLNIKNKLANDNTLCQFPKL